MKTNQTQQMNNAVSAFKAQMRDLARKGEVQIQREAAHIAAYRYSLDVVSGHTGEAVVLKRERVRV